MTFKKFLFIIILCLSSLTGYAVTDNMVRTVPEKGTVALTFDDGPSPIYTPQILAILKKYNIKATFFMVGENAQKYPDMVKLVLADGHAIASHSLTHPKLTKLNDRELTKEIVMPQNIIYKIVGRKPTCLRYPFGLSNEHVREAIRSHGIVPVSMGFNSFDYERPGVEKMINWVVKNAHSGQVILLHDGYENKEQTVEALPKIIEGIKKKGLSFSQICKDTTS